MVIEQQSHQLGHGDRRMGVIELHGPVTRKVLNGDAAALQVGEHVLQRAAHKEVLLHQPQAAATVGAVVGIQHLREGFTAHLGFNGAMKIAAVEGMEIKRFGGLGPPQPQPAAAVDPIPRHRHIVGDALHHLGRHPAHPVAALLVVPGLGAPAEAHALGLGGMDQLPGPAPLEPFVGDLDLPAAFDQLVKDAELVANAVAGGGNLQRRQRFAVAGRQATQAAIAETGFLLHGKHLLGVADAEARQGLAGFGLQAQHQQIVGQLGADQKLGREVGHRLGALLPHQVLGGQVPVHQPVAHRKAQRHVQVMGAGINGAAAQRKEQVLGDAFKQVIGRQAGALTVAEAGRHRQGCALVSLGVLGERHRWAQTDAHNLLRAR